MELSYKDYIEKIPSIRQNRLQCHDFFEIDGESYKLIRPTSINKSDLLEEIKKEIENANIEKATIEYKLVSEMDEKLYKEVEIANKKIMYAGGSSRVFSKALKL